MDKINAESTKAETSFVQQ